MEYIEIQGGIRISRLGLGGWQFAQHGWGETDLKELEGGLRVAIEREINFIDTAPIYGLGESEINLGRMLKGRRDKVVIASKFGMKWDTNNGKVFVEKDSSPKRMEEELNDSLKRLGTDYIDLYQLHWPDGKTDYNHLFDLLERKKEEGKIRAYGVCNYSKDDFSKLTNPERLATNQICYNLIERDPEDELLPYCMELGVPVIVHTALAKGLLSGKYNSGHTFGDNDHRSRDKYFQPDNIEKNLATASRLNEIARETGCLPEQVALKWLLVNDKVASVLVGIKNEKQIKTNVGAFEIAESLVAGL